MRRSLGKVRQHRGAQLAPLIADLRAVRANATVSAVDWWADLEQAKALAKARQDERDAAYRRSLGVVDGPLPKVIGNVTPGRPPMMMTPSGRKAVTGWYGDRDGEPRSNQ